MPKFLESKLRDRYGANSDVPFKIMNAAGLMHGNKETAKGRAADLKHAQGGDSMAALRRKTRR